LPELPEVETIAADLRPHLVGRTLTACDLRFPAVVRYPEPEAFARGLPGQRIEALTRRGKYILHHLSGGSLLVVHLGMTGEWRLAAAADPEPAHLHAVLALDDGRQLRWRDVRRFGRLLLGIESELLAARKLPQLGPEPIDPKFTAADLHRRLRRRRAPIKLLLLDQSVLAGVGNIYADEALHQAGIRPDRPSGAIGRPRIARLRAALDVLLRQAIANRGSSVDSYRDAWGELGAQQEQLRVYGRGGQPCLTCGRALTLTRLGGRSTVFCRRCQR